MRTFWRSLLFPPSYREALSPAQLRYGLKALLVAIGAGIGTDVFIVLALSGDSRIDQSVLAWFGVCNIGLLTLLAVWIWWCLRRGDSLDLRATIPVVVTACVTTVIWVQMTGTLTSYFVMACVAALFIFRLYYGYWIGLAAFLCLVLLHGGAVVLEAVGVLQPESLFLGAPSRMYEVSWYRWTALYSLALSYLVTFMSANMIVNKLREKDQLLARVRRQMARVAEEVKHGRFTGAILGDAYVTGEVLGRGGMGEVYMARRIADGHPLAIKVMHSHLLHEQSMVERFRREARAAERIAAHFTARVLDVGYDASLGVHYIAMEYLRGEDLAAFLRRCEPLPSEQIIALAAGIAQAIDAAHGAGIVHRDLKPHNIYLVHGETWRSTVSSPVGSVTVTETMPPMPMSIRLLDFGMSKILDSKDKTVTHAGALIGTVGYMAPEQALARTDLIGPAADRFAFAAIVYRMLTGRLPFTSGELIDAIREVVYTHPPPPSSLRPGVPDGVDAVMAIGLAKMAEDRYDSATHLVDDLRAAYRARLPDAVYRRAAALRHSVSEADTVRG